jgi:hypothetical protein
MIKSRRMRWAEHVERMRTKRSTYTISEKPEGKRPFGRLRCSLEDNIKRNLKL